MPVCRTTNVYHVGFGMLRQSCLLHHLRLPTLPSIPILSQVGSSREPMRRYLTEAHDPDYVPEPVYPEYIPLEDEHVFSAEEQPLPPVDSPTTESPGYVAESDLEEDPEEYEDEETKDGPVDYPMDRGDDGDDDDGDSFGDDVDDKDEDNEDEDEEEEEEEHLALADSVIVVPTVEPASISLPPEAEVERLLAMTTPSPSPPISLSPPSAGERLARCTAPPEHSSPPPVPSPLLPSSGCPTQIQTLRIASTQALIDAVTAALPSPPLPPLSPSIYIPPPVDRRDDVPESKLPPRKSLVTSGVDAEARQQGISEVGYGIRDTWVDPAEAVPEVAPITVGEVNTRVTELAELHGHDIQDLYALLEDAQDGRTRISQRAYASREAWAHAIGLSQAVHFELQTHREQVYAYESQLHAHQTQLQLQSTLIQTQHQVHENHFQMQQAEMAKLQETDRRRQAQMVETLRVMRDMRQIMAPVTRRGPNTPPNNTNPNNMTPESVQAMIDQALQRNSTNGDKSHSSHGDNRRNVQTARPCFYADFMKCQPLNFKGTEGVVGLTKCIEKMESVFNISGYAIENQVKFATCTLLGAALTWWNSQIRTLGPDAYSMTWEVLKKKMTDKYCPQGEVKKLEIELWNLKVKGNDVSTYTERFQELTLICTKFVANETEKVDKYINGLPDNIYGNVKSTRPKTLDETIELANELMDQKLRTYAERKTDNIRKADDSSRNNHGHQQQPFKRQNVSKVYNMGSSGNTNVANTQKGNGENPKGNGCFKCGAPGHFKRDCPKLENKDGGNRSAQGWVYAVGNAEKKGNASRDPDSNVVTGTFLLNNRYASILFNTGADRSFISSAFSSLIDIAQTPLENSYDVELADGKIVGVDTIMRGCTLNFLNHPFNIDLMPVELGSFDVIIGMDWLRRCHAMIVYDEKLVRIPYGNETLIFCGNESNNGRESRLAIISCSKAQEYMSKGCQIFLAQISAKKKEDKGLKIFHKKEEDSRKECNLRLYQSYEIFPATCFL
ncbi:reverse transcriptase domain-containing protein [Tanacetum coccineum]|uniref:Reverse transcriptase domain-containing protein n=1 Tax=Tanacetum coccineum TaxID=301880 RepID=A0ABQ5H2W9_9ASTR